MMLPQENVYGHKKRILWFLEEIETIIKNKSLKQNEIRILDVGCGTGEMVTLPIARHGYSVIGIDTDSDSISYAQKNNKLPHVRFLCGKLDQLTHQTFDVIICSEVLEHLSKPETLLLEMRKLLKPHGIILLTTPNGYGWFEIEKFVYETVGLKKIIDATLGRLWKAIIWFYWNAGIKKLRDRLRKIPFVPAPHQQNTLKAHDVHLQHFTVSSLKRLFKKTSLQPITWRGSSLMAGPMSNWALRRFPRVLRINAQIANYVPPQLASGWYISLQKT